MTSERTDAEGRYSIDLVTGAGRYRVRVNPYQGGMLAPVYVELAAGEERLLDLALPIGGIDVVARDTVTSEPVAGLSVSLRREDDVHVASARTDEEGRASFDNVNAGTFLVYTAGHQESRREYQQLFSEPVRLAAGSRAETTLLVDRGATLAGAALTANGLPLKDGADVRLVRVQAGELVPRPHAMTQIVPGSDPPRGKLVPHALGYWETGKTESGRYEFRALPPGDYVVAIGKASSDEVRDLGTPVTLAEHETRELEVRAEP